MKKYTGLHKLSDNRFLNLFKLDALTDGGKPFDYFFVTRRKDDRLKLITHDSSAEGVVIFPVLKDEPEKVVMIRQYRYPLDDYIYELPAGLIDEGENAAQSAVREMKEETGLSFEVYGGGATEYRRPFFMGAGFTDESCCAVFGYASGKINRRDMEETESIQVVVADRDEIRRILKEEKVSIRAAYLLMAYLNRPAEGTDADNPFSFLDY